MIWINDHIGRLLLGAAVLFAAGAALRGRLFRTSWWASMLCFCERVEFEMAAERPKPETRPIKTQNGHFFSSAGRRCAHMQDACYRMQLLQVE